MGKSYQRGSFVLLAACVSALSVSTFAESNVLDEELDCLTKQLSSENYETRETAVEYLSYMRAFSVTYLVAKLANDKSAEVRREVAMNLAWTGDINSIPVLVKLLDDEDWTVSQAAVNGLINLTALDLKYDALGQSLAEKNKQKELIKEKIAKFNVNSLNKLAAKKLPDDINLADKQNQFGKDIYAKGDFYYEYAKLLRALGSCGDKNSTKYVINAIKPYLTQDLMYRPISGANQAINRLERNMYYKYKYTPESQSVIDRGERLMVQAGIRALGRLGGKNAEKTLITLLNEKPVWSSYAAEALGDINTDSASLALINALPEYSVNYREWLAGDPKDKPVVSVDISDKPYLTSADRMPKTAFYILQSLSRANNISPEVKAQIREYTPYLVALFPTHWDANVYYQEEPYQKYIRYILEEAGIAQDIKNAAFKALGFNERTVSKDLPHRESVMRLAALWNYGKNSRYPSFSSNIISALARDKEDIPLLEKMLDNVNGWVKIDATRALIFNKSHSSLPKIKHLLTTAPDDASYGFNADYFRFGKGRLGDGYDEYNDPSPRFKTAYINALGYLNDKSSDELLIKFLNNDKNVIEVQYEAAVALCKLKTPKAIAALKKAATFHPVASVRLLAREAIFKQNIQPFAFPKNKTRTLKQLPIPTGKPQEIVFIKGTKNPGNHYQISKDQTGYSTTDAGPTYRLGKNIFKINTANPQESLQQLTHFKTGFVADLEVSYDGKKILFARQESGENPWWHIYEIDADGKNLRQITFGPYHDVQPIYLPDGRLMFSTSRVGGRDEYHGYPITGLATINYDGSAIKVIGFNAGRDNEASVTDDGQIVFSRLEVFYSRMKTELNLITVSQDGSKPTTIYGPERRHFWSRIGGAGAVATPRHRALRITQPSYWGDSMYLINSFRGPMLVGPGRYKERFLRPNNEWAVTTPWKIDDKTVLVAAGKRPLKIYSKKNVIGQPSKKYSKKRLDDWAPTDLGLYYMDVDTGKLQLIYNDPKTTEFEARPLQPRKLPPVMPSSLDETSFMGTLYCSSIFTTQHHYVKKYGKYIRVIEGIVPTTRVQTHMNGGIAWRNHGGTTARILGTIPVAADGSFMIQLPADRVFHLQVLDADKKVIGNEIVWQYVRPNETKGCIGCHEMPDGAPESFAKFPEAIRTKPVQLFPKENDIRYRAKLWFKGYAPDEREERLRTANSISVHGRE
ncbi:HEAT repeat domain-containing protein [Lentisphaerota bacterium WC36G]|nr:HEAT repeat domain-containing protein [Lentisphaerae bacterium WC36]